jgi:hypothetical protein
VQTEKAWYSKIKIEIVWSENMGRKRGNVGKRRAKMGRTVSPLNGSPIFHHDEIVRVDDASEGDGPSRSGRTGWVVWVWWVGCAGLEPMGGSGDGLLTLYRILCMDAK